MSNPSPIDSEQGALRVDEDLVRHVARLARLELKDEELPETTKQFASILKYLEQIPDVGDAEEDAVVRTVEFERLRDDVEGNTLPLRDTMTNAPANDGAFIVVPRFFDDEDA